MKTETVLTIISSAVSAVASYFLGPINGLMTALVSLMALDVIFGAGASITQGKLSSAVGAKGLVKKIGVWGIIAVAHIVGSQVLGMHELLRDAAIGGFITIEAISILENAGIAGIPIPPAVKDAIEKLKGLSNTANPEA